MKHFFVFCEGYLCDQVGVLIDVGNEDYLDDICEQVQNVATSRMYTAYVGRQNLDISKMFLYGTL